MKKKFFAVLALAILLTLSMAQAAWAATVASGECGAEGDNVTWVLDDTGTLTISGTGDMADYDISNNRAPWYDNKGNIQTVIIEDGVTSIGKQSFMMCASLDNLEIPNSVTIIDDNAFSYCTNLIIINIPASVKTIGGLAFCSCENLTTINLSEGLITIGDSAFDSCTSLTQISIPVSVTNIGSTVFAFCNNLRTITLGNCVADNMFREDENNNLQTINLSADFLVSLPENVFDRYTKLNNINVDNANPNYASVEGILYSKDKTVLIRCPEGKSGECNIPNVVTKINYGAFKNCVELSKVVIPDSVNVMGGDSITYTGAGIFEGCAQLKTVGPVGVGYDIELSWTNTLPGFSFYNDDSIVSVVIPDGVTTIFEDTFYNCHSLTDVVIPDSVNRLEPDAFWKCENLVSIIIPGSVIYMGEKEGDSNSHNSSFNECTSLVSAGPIGGDYNIQFGWTDKIPPYAFLYSGVTTITLPDTITEIGDGAFWGSKLAHIEIPTNVTIINNSVFRDTCLEKFTIPNTITTIGQDAFAGSQLTEIIIPDSVTTIETDAFTRTQLTDVTIPKNVTTMGWTTFSDTPLVNVTVSEGVKQLAWRTFENCTNLTTVNLPASLTNLNGRLFSGCIGLSDIYYGGSKKSWTNMVNRLEQQGTDSIFFETDINPTIHYAIDTFDVSFESNGGSGSMDVFLVDDGEEFVLPSCGFSAPTGKTFKAWQINGQEYAPGDKYTVTANVVITAIWQDSKSYAVAFDANGGTGTMPTLSVAAGNEYILPECGFTAPENQEFKTWQIAGIDYAVNDTYIVNADTVIKAIWQNLPEVPKYTVTFAPNGGSGAMSVQTVESGTEITLPECAFAVPQGQEFKAWQIASQEYAPGDKYTVTDNVVVTAVWQDKLAEPTPAEKVDKELQDILDNTQATAEEIKDTLENLANGDLQEIVQDIANNKFNEIFDKIADLENKIQGSATINVDAGLGFVNTSVKVVGAKLNFDYESSVRLDIGKPHDEDIEVDKPQNADLFRFSMQLIEGANNNVTELTVPMRVTLPVPGRNPNPQSIKLWHFHNGSLAPVELTRTPFKENGQWYITFKISGFSDFIMEYTEVEENNDIYTITFDTNGGILADGASSMVQVKKGCELTMPAASKSGYTFRYWQDKKDENKTYAANNAYSFMADTDLLAIWQYNGGGGSSGGGHRPATKPSESKPGSTAETQKLIITGENINTVFADVRNNAWYSEAIAYVYNNGLMKGTEKGFEPNADTTRAMIVTMLHRLEKEPAANGGGFGDVASGQWYSEAVAWAAANGVVKGYNELEFAPEDYITREQLAAILFRYAQFKGLDASARGDLSGFADGAAVADWAEEAVQWAVGAGLLNGDEGRLRPADKASRAEVAMLLMRFAESVK